VSPDDAPARMSGDDGSSTLGSITPIMVAHLRATKPWARLVSMVGFVGSGLILLVGLILPFVGAFSHNVGGAVGGIAMGIVYVLLGCLYFFPSLFLFRYASAIHRLLVTGDSESMELALSHQRSFWRFIGIATLVVLCLYAVALVVIVIVAVGSAMK
jgi:hypothetical protein